MTNGCCWNNTPFLVGDNCVIGRGKDVDSVFAYCPKDLDFGFAAALNGSCDNAITTDLVWSGVTGEEPLICYQFDCKSPIYNYTREFDLEACQDEITEEMTDFNLYAADPDQWCTLQALHSREVGWVLHIKKKTGPYQYLNIGAGGGLYVTSTAFTTETMNTTIGLGGEGAVAPHWIDLGNDQNIATTDAGLALAALC